MAYNMEFVDTENEDVVYSFPADSRDHIPKNRDVVDINNTNYTVLSRKYRYTVDQKFGKLNTIIVYLEPKGN